MSTTSSHRPPPKPLDLELTIISAKHLKNVNWRTGDLNPYAIFWLDPDRRLATKSDDSNNTKPIWNERHVIPIPSSLSATILTLEIFHSKPSDTPKPLVGTLRVPIDDLPNPEDSNVVRVYDLRRPSGRPCGKIRLKLAIKERPIPDYQITPQPGYYYQSHGRYPPSPSPYAAPPPPPPRPYQYGSYSPDPYSGYYQGGGGGGGYYSQPPPSPAPRPYSERPLPGEGGGVGALGGQGPSLIGPPSAPVDYAQYEHKHNTGGVPVDYAHIEHKQKLGSVPMPVDYAQYEHKPSIGGTPVDYAHIEHKQKLGSVIGSAPVDYAHYEHKQRTGGVPVDYAHAQAQAQYEHKQKAGKVGSVSGVGLGMEGGGVGAVTGGVAGLGIDEGLRYHDEKVGERVEGDLNARELDDYSGYRRADY